MNDFDHILKDIVAQLQQKNAAREGALADSRQIVRHSANAIRALHRGDYSAAHDHLDRGGEMMAATKQSLAGNQDVYWAGYVQDAQKEFAEANLVAAMITASEIPGPGDLGVENAPYLNGLAEAASEMRRYILDTIRHGGAGELSTADRILEVMDDAYTSLIAVDFPDSITGGLRRTVDALRAVLERTRGDLTITARQTALANALERHARSAATE